MIIANDSAPVPDDETQALILAHVAWATKLAVEFRGPRTFTLDERISVAMEALCTAAASFDQSRGYKFTTYCTKPILGALTDQRQLYASPISVPHDKADDSPNVQRINQMGREGDNFDIPVEDKGNAPAEAREVLNKLLLGLNPQQREVMEARARGENLRQIANNLEMPIGKVRQIQAEAMCDMRKSAQTPGARAT